MDKVTAATIAAACVRTCQLALGYYTAAAWVPNRQ